MGILTDQVSWYRYRDDGEAYMGQGATLQWGLEGYEPIWDVVAFGDAQGAQGDESTIPFGAGPPANNKPDPDAGERTATITVDGGYAVVVIESNPLIANGPDQETTPEATARVECTDFDDEAGPPDVDYWDCSHRKIVHIMGEPGHHHGAKQVELDGVNPGEALVIAYLKPPSLGGGAKGSSRTPLAGVDKSWLEQRIRAGAKWAQALGGVKVEKPVYSLELRPVLATDMKTGAKTHHGSAEWFVRKNRSDSLHLEKRKAEDGQLRWGERPPRPTADVSRAVSGSSTGLLWEYPSGPGSEVTLRMGQMVDLEGGWDILWQVSGTTVYEVYLVWQGRPHPGAATVEVQSEFKAEAWADASGDLADPLLTDPDGQELAGRTDDTTLGAYVMLWIRGVGRWQQSTQAAQLRATGNSRIKESDTSYHKVSKYRVSGKAGEMLILSLTAGIDHQAAGLALRYMAKADLAAVIRLKEVPSTK